MLLQDFNNRVRQLEARNTELTLSLEYSQKEVEDLKEENKTLTKVISDVQQGISKKTDLTNDFQQLQDRIDYLEDYSRRNNLRFTGIGEGPNETWEQTQILVQRLLRDQFKLNDL